MKKNVIVTGTSGSLGTQIAKALLQDGYRVHGVSRRPSEPLIEFEDYVDYQMDLSDPSNFPRFVTDLTDTYGSIYGLVNNAAAGADGLLATMHSSDIANAMVLNLTSPILLTKLAVRSMLLEGEGRIVNITSVVSKTGYKGLSVYAAAKAGLEGFSRSLAREVGRKGITVNSVAPGFMKTAMTEGLGEEDVSRIARRTSLGRLVTESDVAETVKFLMSTSGNSVTGQVWSVDAGA